MTPCAGWICATPTILYEPLPGLHVTDFAFSPDSQKLAVFAAV